MTSEEMDRVWFKILSFICGLDYFFWWTRGTRILEMVNGSLQRLVTPAALKKGCGNLFQRISLDLATF